MYTIKTKYSFFFLRPLIDITGAACQRGGTISGDSSQAWLGRTVGIRPRRLVRWAHRSQPVRNGKCRQLLRQVIYSAVGPHVQ